MARKFGVSVISILPYSLGPNGLGRSIEIAKSAGKRYGSKESGEKVAGAVLAKLRAKESVEESDMDESALQAYLGKKK